MPSLTGMQTSIRTTSGRSRRFARRPRARRRLPHHVQPGLRLEEEPQAAPHERLVVGEQNRGHWRPGFSGTGGADRENGVNGRPSNPRPLHPPADAQRAGQPVRGYPGRVGFASDPRSASAPRRRDRAEAIQPNAPDVTRNATKPQVQVSSASDLPLRQGCHWSIGSWCALVPSDLATNSLGPLSADCVKALRPFAPEHFAATPAREQRSQSANQHERRQRRRRGGERSPRMLSQVSAPDRACNRGVRSGAAAATSWATPRSSARTRRRESQPGRDTVPP